MSGSQLNFHEGRLSATNVRMKTLVQYTYEIEAPQIQGGPNWLAQDRFDIEAKMDDATAQQAKTLSHDQVTRFDRQLVKQLLAERFKLVVHFETKELPVYDLVVDKSGPKLAVTSVKDGGTSISSGHGNLTAKCVTMTRLTQSLTQVLSGELGRVVIDKTEIEG